MTLRQFIKRSVPASMMRVAQPFLRRRAVILRYHSVGGASGIHAQIPPSICHEMAAFQAQMECLRRSFNPITMDDVVRFARGEAEVPARSVAVTFDDGYIDNLETAAPIMQDLGVQGTFYVTTGDVGGHAPPWFARTLRAFACTNQPRWEHPISGRVYSLQDVEARHEARRAANLLCAARSGGSQHEFLHKIEEGLAVQQNEPPTTRLMLNWDEVRELERMGHLVGSHTMSHPNLALLQTEQDLQEEIVNSKHALEHELGHEVAHFSYPNPIGQPHSNERTRDILAQAGYQSAVTSLSGWVDREADCLGLARVSAPTQMSLFRWNLELAFSGRAP